jgi:hypothetical protein
MQGNGATKSAILRKYNTRAQGWWTLAVPGTPLHAMIEELDDNSVEAFLMDPRQEQTLKGKGKGKSASDLPPSTVDKVMSKIIEDYTPGAEANLFGSGMQIYSDIKGENMHGGEALGRLGQSVPALGAADVEKAPLGLLKYIEDSTLTMPLYKKDIQMAKVYLRICRQRGLLADAGDKFATNINWGKLNKGELTTLFRLASDEVELELKEKTSWKAADKLIEALDEVREELPLLSTPIDDGYIALAMPMMEANSPIPDVKENNNAITVMEGALYVGRVGEEVALSKLWSVKKLKWDQEFMRLLFRGLTFHDRVPDCLPGVRFIGYGFCKKTMVRMIYEAAFNDRIVDRTCASTLGAEAGDKGAPVVEIGGKMSAPLSLPPMPTTITMETRSTTENLVFEREDCFFSTNHSELCEAWGLAVTLAQATQAPEQVNEGCDPWPVFEEDLTAVDFCLEGEDLKAAVFGSTDDKHNMEAMLGDASWLMKAVLTLYRKVEVRSGVLLEDKRIKWQGALCVETEDGAVQVLGDIAFAASDLA